MRTSRVFLSIQDFVFSTRVSTFHESHGLLTFISRGTPHKLVWCLRVAGVACQCAGTPPPGCTVRSMPHSSSDLATVHAPL